MLNTPKDIINYYIRDIVGYIVEEQCKEYDVAMNMFYNSETFEKLNDLETGLYYESPSYIYYMFLTEQKYGRLIQTDF